VLHQNVDVPTKLYSENEQFGNISNETGRKSEKNQNKIFDAENVCTRSLTKLIDSCKILM
jgi:hypothetical protein